MRGYRNQDVKRFIAVSVLICAVASFVQAAPQNNNTLGPDAAMPTAVRQGNTLLPLSPQKAYPRTSMPSWGLAHNVPDGITLGALNAEERSLRTRLGVKRIGTNRSVPSRAVSSGIWFSGNAGRRFWQSSVRSEGAVGLRLHFRDFSIDSGQVWIHTGDVENGQVFGPYTGKGTFGDGDFWTEAIFADRIVVEYLPDQDVGQDRPPNFVISEAFHFWEFGRLVSTKDTSHPISCFRDASCDIGSPGVSQAFDGTVYLVVNIGQVADQCSGTVINSESYLPYVLTAGHCAPVDQIDLKSVLTVFDFQTSGCNLNNAVDYTKFPQVSGAYLVSYSNQSLAPPTSGNGIDFALLKLPYYANITNPNISSTPVGWTTASLTQGSRVVSVSHPENLSKKSAFGLIAQAQSPVYVVNWTNGAVSEGSSGSGLFDQSGLLRGVLSFGQGGDILSCPTNTVVYTDFNSIYGYIGGALNANIQTSPSSLTLNSSGLGQATITWKAITGVTSVEIHANSPDGLLIGKGGATGSIDSGLVLTNGMLLYLQPATGVPLSFQYTMATFLIGPGGTGTPPLITFAANPTSIPAGSSSLLQWATTGATSVSIDQGIGAVSTSGTRTVTPSATTSYTLTATNSTGSSATRVTIVTVVPTGGGGGSGTVTFTAAPAVCNASGKGIVTLTWSAPGLSNLVIRVGSSAGSALTGPLGSSGTAATGDWVTNGMQFFLVDSTGHTLASTTASVNCAGTGGGTGGTVTFTAAPAVCNASGKGIVTLTWSAPGLSNLVIRVGSSAGSALTGPLGSSGTAATGDWVTNGMQFFLVDSTGHTLASTTASVNCAGSGGGTGGTVTFTAAPAVCNSSGKGIVTLTWNAPGLSNLVIRIGSSTGNALTGLLGSSGTAATGDWVTNGMQFFLVDSTGHTLASTTASVNCAITFTSAQTGCLSDLGIVTLTWNAPGFSNLVIRVGTPSGSALTGLLGIFMGGH